MVLAPDNLGEHRGPECERMPKPQSAGFLLDVLGFYWWDTLNNFWLCKNSKQQQKPTDLAWSLHVSSGRRRALSGVLTSDAYARTPLVLTSSILEKEPDSSAVSSENSTHGLKRLAEQGGLMLDEDAAPRLCVTPDCSLGDLTRQDSDKT